MKITSLTASAVALLAGISAAEAETRTFTFSFSGTIGAGTTAAMITGSGTFLATLTSTGPDVYHIMSGGGSSPQAGTLTLLADGTYTNTVSPTINLTADNIFTPSATPALDGDGIVFEGSLLAAGSDYFEVGGKGGGYYYANNYNKGLYNNTYFGPGTFNITFTAVPEPSTWAMMAIGFAGLAFAGYRKSKGGVAAVSAGRFKALDG
jgi:hypothetical protein